VTPKRGRGEPAHPITDAELADAAPLFPALSKALLKAGPPLPSVMRRQGMLGERHTRVLFLLKDGPLSVSDLSSRLDVTLSTASLLVGELSRAGLVDRKEDEQDRRRTIVDLAPAHRDEVGNFLRRRASYVRVALEQLEPWERAALVKGLRAVVAALEASATDP
jgi:DNA-binding MarR family transcriptional regulator